MGIMDMLNANLVLRIRIIAYGVLIFFSFFIFIGGAVMKDEQGISCPLYCDRGTYLSRGRYVAECGAESNCNFPIAIAIIFQLLYLLIRIALLVLLMIGKLSPEMFFFSDLMELVYLAVDLLAFFFTFIGACILSAGTNYTCSEFSCDDLDFYSSSKAAQAGAWISTFVWLFVGLVGFLFLMRAGKLPCFPGAATRSDPDTAGSQPPPSMDAPPQYPDDPPKY